MQTSEKINQTKTKTNKQTSRQQTNEINRARKHTSKHKQTFNSQVPKYAPHVPKTLVFWTCISPKLTQKTLQILGKLLKYQTNTLSAHFVQHHTLTFAELFPRRYDSWTLVFPNFVKLLMGKKL